MKKQKVKLCITAVFGIINLSPVNSCIPLFFVKRFICGRNQRKGTGEAGWRMSKMIKSIITWATIQRYNLKHNEVMFSYQIENLLFMDTIPIVYSTKIFIYKCFLLCQIAPSSGQVYNDTNYSDHCCIKFL